MSSRSCNYISLDVTQEVQVVMPVEVHIFLLNSVHNRAWFPRWSTGSLYSYSLATNIACSDHDSFHLNSCFFMVKQNKQEQPFLHNLSVASSTFSSYCYYSLMPNHNYFFRGSKVAKNNPKIYNNKK